LEHIIHGYISLLDSNGLTNHEKYSGHISRAKKLLGKFYIENFSISCESRNKDGGDNRIASNFDGSFEDIVATLVDINLPLKDDLIQLLTGECLLWIKEGHLVCYNMIIIESE
jgi:hypothetical protein